MTEITAVTPFGKAPFAVKFVKRIALCSPSNETKPSIAPSPKIMKIIIAITLIEAKKDSASAKLRTLRALIAKIITANKVAKSHVGTFGNQRPISIAAPRNSVPSATVQQIQYNQATVKPVPGLINFVA